MTARAGARRRGARPGIIAEVSADVSASFEADAGNGAPAARRLLREDDAALRADEILAPAAQCDGPAVAWAERLVAL
jgi:hypothetical protein